MARVKKTVWYWLCERCGHEWPPKGEGEPTWCRSAKARTGTNHGKTSALWRLAQDRVLASRVSGDREGVRRVVDAVLH